MSPAEIKGLEYIRDAGVYAYLEETIEQVGIDVWWKLLQLGFVSRDDRGRVTLTRIGRAELAKQAPLSAGAALSHPRSAARAPRR